MINILLFFLILFLPAYSEAAYNIYLKNGSVITGVSTLEKRGGEYTIYYGGGIIGIPEADILKIEETGAPEKDFRVKEGPEQVETSPTGEPSTIAPAEEPFVSGKKARAEALRAELESIEAELKTVEENEARLIASIDEKRNIRRSNVYQFRLMEKQLEPLQKELSEVQQKKGELLQRKAYIEGELRALQ